MTIVSKIEIYIILKHYFNSKHEWEKLHFLRTGVLIVCETIKTYNKHNKRLGELSTNDNLEIIGKFKEVSKELKHFKKVNKFDSKLNNIRNTTIGHINEDFIKYYDDIKSINQKSYILMLMKFVTILDIINDLASICIEEEQVSDEISLEVSQKAFEIFEKYIP